MTDDDATKATAPAELVLDESGRPYAPAVSDDSEPDELGRALGEHFLQVHDHYRAQMQEVLETLTQVARGAQDVGVARDLLHDLTVRANDWVLGGLCQRQCLDLTQHHSIEDTGIFPHLRAHDTELGPVLDRLTEEHHLIHRLLVRVDSTLVQLVSDPYDLGPLTAVLTQLGEVLTSHFAYEEDQILGPLQRFGFYEGQLGRR